MSRPVPNRRHFHPPLTRTSRPPPRNLSRCALPSRPAEKISLPSRPVDKTYPYTVPARRQNLPLRPVPPQNLSLSFRPAVKTCLYRVSFRHHCRHSFPSRYREMNNTNNRAWDVWRRQFDKPARGYSTVSTYIVTDGRLGITRV